MLIDTTNLLVKSIGVCKRLSNYLIRYERKLLIDSIYQPLRSAGYDTRSIFLSGVQQVWIQSFPSPSLSYYLPIAGGRIIGFIPFPSVLGLCEKCNQSRPGFELVSPCPIPTTINHYSTGTSINYWLINWF